MSRIFLLLLVITSWSSAAQTVYKDRWTYIINHFDDIDAPKAVVAGTASSQFSIHKYDDNYEMWLVDYMVYDDQAINLDYNVNFLITTSTESWEFSFKMNLVYIEPSAEGRSYRYENGDYSMAFFPNGAHKKFVAAMKKGEKIIVNVTPTKIRENWSFTLKGCTKTFANLGF